MEETKVATTETETTGSTLATTPIEKEDKSLVSEASPAEEKPTESKTSAPEKYEFKLPEGMEVDSELLKTVEPIFKELGVSQEGAQKLAEAYAPYVQKMSEAMDQRAIEGYKQTVEAWKAETIKQFGENSKEELASVGKFVIQFGTPELRQILDETGLGNHPEIVKAFAKAGKAVSQDKFVEPSKTSSPRTDDIYKTMYPSMAKN